MTTIALIIAALLNISCMAASQDSDTFQLRITKVRRVKDGCTAEGESAKVRFKISSDMSAPCAMLRAGEIYEVLRAVAEKDSGDETKDVTILVIYNNVKNSRRDNSVFDVDSEEAIAQPPAHPPK
jgi:hypothetical protein